MDPEQTLVELELAIRLGAFDKATQLATAYTEWRCEKNGFEPTNGDVRFAALMPKLLQRVSDVVTQCVQMFSARREAVVSRKTLLRALSSEVRNMVVDIGATTPEERQMEKKSERDELMQKLKDAGVGELFLEFNGCYDEGVVDTHYETKPPVMLSDDLFNEVSEYIEEQLNAEIPDWCNGRGRSGDVGIDVPHGTIMLHTGSDSYDV